MTSASGRSPVAERLARVATSDAPQARPARPDRVGLALLGAGHFAVDMTVGALPALLPTFTALYALSNLEAAIILAASLGASSATQPLFGLIADRRPAPWLLAGGVVVAGLGLALAGVVGGYAGVLACAIGSGLGVAVYHPEAARLANRMSPDAPASGLAWFMVGGHLGFAAGPLIAALFVPLIGARATLVYLVPALAIAGILSLARARVTIAVPAPSPRAAASTASHVPGLILLIVVTSMRTWTLFGLLALVPLLVHEERGWSQREADLTLFGFAGAGAVGTILGAWLARRLGGRAMLMWSLPVVSPFVAGFLLLDGAASAAALVLAGLVLLASFSVTVAMGQDYLPNRMALAAGLMIGFAAIGSAAPGLALIGALADAAGRETALWTVAALPLVGAALAAALPPAPTTRMET